MWTTFNSPRDAAAHGLGSVGEFRRLERELQLTGVRFDLSGEGWPTSREGAGGRGPGG